MKKPWWWHLNPWLASARIDRRYMVAIDEKLDLALQVVHLESEAKRLRDSAAAARARQEHAESVGDTLANALDKATAEVERLRKDAERYQQVRRGQKWSVIDGIGATLRGERLDDAIDAAIAAGKDAKS